MARILFATLPISGHVRPGLPVARELVSAGHEVTWYTGRKFEPLIRRTGARFVATGVGGSSAEHDVLQAMPGAKSGLAGFRRIIHELFIDPIPAYTREIQPLIDAFGPDVIVSDHCFLAAPMVAKLRRIGSVVYVVGPLAVTSRDTAPPGTGLPPSSTHAGRLRNRGLNWLARHVVFRDVQRALVRSARTIGFPPLDAFLADWTVHLADRYLVAAVPDFEYPRSDLPPAVEFIGPILPSGVDDWMPPSWWPELEDARASGRPVILVTQGTAATDPSQLILPAVTALADLDALIVTTTVDADPDDVLQPAGRPANVRAERFVPFTELLPLTDLMVTNGGYGGVQLSLAFGVPLVTAGISEDKMEVNQRVAWTGAGISLKTSHPDPRQIRAAATAVLGDSAYRARAGELKAVYDRYSGVRGAAKAILETAGATTSPRRG